ncbi:fructose-6-phosphate aldolase [Candidatus Woesearchaeota archaeon RBG_13_36_6]|nr:MAG: fructose-6-phosphate aldolase [Candidatus Woesearchaeota archaeon RBG_13_36_6]
MKIFIDTADVEAIKKFNDIGIIDGVTTNPTLVAKTGRDFASVANEIIKIVDGPISLEAVSEDARGMIREAEELSKIHKNVVVKIPMTAEGLKAVKVLSKKGIKTNVTLVFSANQALAAAKAGASYVSPFVGRLDDAGQRGMEVVEQTKEIFEIYNIKTQVISASIRHPLHVIESALAGADVATIPPDVLDKMLKHPLTDKGVKAFLDDWKKVPKK